MTSTTTHLMTAEELLLMEDDGLRHELVKGELLTMSPSNAQHGAVTMNLSILLGQFVKKNRLGTLFAAETGFKLETNPDTVLAPDIAFIQKERVGEISESYRWGPPDLVVEVLSPGDRRGEVERKTARWLSLGAMVVWLVNSRKRIVDVRFANGEQKLLSENDELTGDPVIPGFRVRVSEIFA